MRPDAAPPRCPHRPPCPGCPRFGEPGIAPDARAGARALCAEAGLHAPASVEGAPFGYRHRARLAVRGRAASPKIGIFQEGSHRIVDIPRCLRPPPAGERGGGRGEGRRAPDGRRPVRGPRPSRAAALRAGGRRTRAADARRSCWSRTTTTPRPSTPLAAGARGRARRAAPQPVVERQPGTHQHHPGSALGHRWAGRRRSARRWAAPSVFFPPGAFGQANLPLFERLVAQVAALGAGRRARASSSTPAAARSASACCPASRALAFNEVAPGVARRASPSGSPRCPSDERAPARRCCPARRPTTPRPCRDADVVIVDPPRAGSTTRCSTRCSRDPPPRLIAVSCNPDAFLREARALLAGGRLRLAAVVPCALFPHTAHVETLACFTRR